MNFCYCVGGTGARVAEIAAHLCAMNLVDDQDITFIIVDKDATCGGTEQAKRVIQSVASLAAVNNDGGVALKRSTIIDAQGTKEFCKSGLFVESWDFTQALDTVAPRGITGTASLEASLCSSNQMLRETDALLLDAFYSAKEQEQNTARGFYGHPSIGAAVFKYMIKTGGWDNPAVNYESDIAAPVKNYLNGNAGQTARIFIIGSIFGGTGASIFSNLAYHIRNSVKPADKDRILMSGVLLLPYFKFVDKNDKNDKNIEVKHSEFYAKSKVALEQYANDPNLFKTKVNTGGSFDSLYICGQNPLHVVNDYHDGGKDQTNHFDFVDLAAAKAMTEFFAMPQENIIGGKIFEYRLNPTADTMISSINFNNTADIEKPLRAMLTFSAFVITRIFGAFKLRENDPYNNRLVRMLYGTSMNEGPFKGHRPTAAYVDANGVKEQIEKVSNLVFDYCGSYIRFLRDFAVNGHDWSNTGNDSHDKEYSFFNSSYIEALHDIITMIENNNTNVGKNIEDFIGRSDYLPNLTNGLTVKAIENAMEVVFRKAPENYDKGNISPDQRIADYIHEVFKYCSANA